MKPILFSFVFALFDCRFAHADLIRVSSQTLTDSNINVATMSRRNVKLCVGWTWDEYNEPSSNGSVYTTASLFHVEVQVSGKTYKLPLICNAGDPSILSYLVAIKNGQFEQKDCKVSETCDKHQNCTSTFGTHERQYYVDLLTNSAGQVTDYLLNMGPWSACH